jgi:hypothetical protein
MKLISQTYLFDHRIVCCQVATATSHMRHQQSTINNQQSTSTSTSQHFVFRHHKRKNESINANFIFKSDLGEGWCCINDPWFENRRTTKENKIDKSYDDDDDGAIF